MRDILSTEEKEAIAEAVKYWAGFLKRDKPVIQNNGEPSQFMMMNMLSTLGGIVTYPEDQIVEFELSLTELLTERVKMRGGFFLDTDYHPEGDLRTALDQSIKKYNSMSIFPCKTNMAYSDGILWISEGYRADRITLYPIVPRKNNNNLLKDNYNYVIFFPSVKNVEIIIDFKRYNCDLDVVGLGLDSDADSIKVEKRGDKFYVKKLLTPIKSSNEEREINVFEYIGELKD